MLNSTFYLAGIFLVLFCTAGFSGSSTSDYAIDTEGYSDVVTSHTVLSLSTESSIVLINTGLSTVVCVLRGNAGRGEKTEFSECIANSGCTSWTQNTDSSNGNTSMVCEPT